MFEHFYNELLSGESYSITKITGCKKPCFYKRYNIVQGETTSESDVKFWAASNFTRVEKEQLVYPLSSLVAEFGGTLGLFLGFSFLAAWNELSKGLVFIKSKIH